MTPLYLAAYKGCNDIVRMLAEKGVRDGVEVRGHRIYLPEISENNEAAVSIPLGKDHIVLVANGGEKVITSCKILQKMSGAASELCRPQFQNEEKALPFKAVTLQSIVNILKKDIKENAPVFQLDPLFFEETDEHTAYTLLDIPRQIREMIHDDIQPLADLDDLKDAADFLELDWLVQILQNPEAQSVADLFVYNESPKINLSNQRCDLSNRNLISLAGMHFYQGLLDLKELDLMGNKIRHNMQDTFDRLKNLEILDLKGNEICDIGSALALLRHLKVLDLQKNKIRDIQNAFGELHNLMFLDLRENEIHEIGNALTRLPNLKRLDLGVNKIHDIKGVFDGLQQLLYLDISYNRILQSIPDALPDTIKQGHTFFVAKGNSQN